MEHFKTNRGKPGILYDGFRYRKDRNSKTEPRRPIFLQRGSNTISWPRKSCEYIGASVTPKLSANAPLLCAQVYDRRKRNFCKMSANVIAPKIDMDLQVIGRIRIVAIFLNTSMMDSNTYLLTITINMLTEAKFTVMT